MIILPDQNAVYVAIPRTGSKSMSLWLERAFRNSTDTANMRHVESLHDWHANLSEAREACEFPLFRMWSFAVVRNPFDRLVSWAAMSDPAFAYGGSEAIRRLLDAEPTRWMLPQVHFVDGVQQLYQFERLPQAISELRLRLQVPEDIEFPQEHETQHYHYRAYFDDIELRTRVLERYAADFDAFDYRF